MDGGTQVLKMPGPKPSAMSDAHHHDNPPPSPTQDQSQLRASYQSPRLPNLYFDGIKVTPPAKDASGSPLPSVGGRDHRDLRVGLPKIPDSGSRASDDESRRRRVPTRARSFMPTPRTVAQDELLKTFNPDPVPFHPQLFNDPLRSVRVIGNSMSTPADDTTQTGTSLSHSKYPPSNRSSTMVKKYPPQARHPTMWGTEGEQKAKGYVFHTDRYQWDDIFPNQDEFTQRGRLQMEMDYVERLKAIRRRREIIPHREPQEFVMGGQQVELNERDDVMQELRKLKGMILPTVAKDLYVGRGFSKSLPRTHALNKPRAINTKGGAKNNQHSPGVAATANGDGHANIGEEGTGDWSHKTAPPSTPDQVLIDDEFINTFVDAWIDKNASPAPNRDNQVAGETKDQNGDQEQSNTNQPGNEMSSSASNVNEIMADESKQETQNEKQHSDSNSPLLKGTIASELMGSEETDALKGIHESCVTDNEGHLKAMNELRTEFPAELTSSQDIYIGQIFEIATRQSFITFDEFCAFYCIREKISSLQGEAKEAFDTVNKDDLGDMIVTFEGLFTAVDKDNSGKIPVESLREMLGQVVNAQEVESKYTDILVQVDQKGEGALSKIDFLAYIPFFLTFGRK